MIIISQEHQKLATGSGHLGKKKLPNVGTW
jgi:hypothetical protein